MAITLSDLLDEKQIALNLSPRDQPAALREIVGLLADNGKIDNPEKFLEQLVAREQARLARSSTVLPFRMCARMWSIRLCSASAAVDQAFRSSKVDPQI